MSIRHSTTGRIRLRSTAVRSLAALIVFSVSVLSLSACGPQSQTPTEVLQSYIDHLNEGEFEDALALVVDPGEVTPEVMEKVEGVTLNDAHLASDQEIDDEVTAVTLQYVFGEDAEFVDVSFLRDEGESWKITEAMFINHVEQMERADGGKGQAVENGSTFVTDSGQELFKDGRTWLVMPEMYLPITVTLEPNMMKPQTFPGEVSPGEIEFSDESAKSEPSEEGISRMREAVEGYTETISAEDTKVPGGYTMSNIDLNDPEKCKSRDTGQHWNDALGRRYSFWCIGGEAEFTFNEDTDGKMFVDSGDPLGTAPHKAGETERYRCTVIIGVEEDGSIDPDIGCAVTGVARD